MVTAKGVTNETGQRHSLSIKVDNSINETRKDPWIISINSKTGRLGDILSDNKYSLISRYLLNEKGVKPDDYIEYGNNGIVRMVKCGGAEYRSSSYRLYARRK